MSRLTIPDVQALRLASQDPSSLTSYKQYDAFKSSHSLSKAKSLSLKHHFSIESRNFSGASLKKLATPCNDSPRIPLGTGRPNVEFFPWNRISAQGQTPIEPCIGTEANEPVSQTASRYGGAYNLSNVLDYGHAAGAPQLLRFVTEHVEIIHNPPYSDWGTCLSSGSTSALEIALRIFCNRGDTVLAEQHTYPGFIEVANLVGVKVKSVDMDEDGISAQSLEMILRNQDKSDNTKLSVLYTIPSGQNPTGISQTLERKQEIYKLAEKYDLVIIEDDPYYFLHLGPHGAGGVEETSGMEFGKSTTKFWKDLVPSYVSLDRSGRVVRLDSTSKILAPGLRAGWITANDSIIDKFLSYHEVCTASVSGPAQLMLFQLLDQSWGHEGFLTWLGNLSRRYRKRRDIVLRACDTYLPQDICSWTIPTYGMFLWVKVDLSKHPVFAAHATDTQCAEHLQLQRRAIEKKITDGALKNGVQVANGALFEVSKKFEWEIYFRLTFVAAVESTLETGVQEFAQAIIAEFK
ncbi:aromatic amino acid aminotransferase [Nemania sp. FL0916]|nr:aromatic amino acid aminotransferase [Nemania sp. FL0916]